MDHYIFMDHGKKTHNKYLLLKTAEINKRHFLAQTRVW